MSLSFVLASLVMTQTPPDYIAETTKWRLAADASLRQNEGWLSVAGLFWLDEGANSVGTRSGSKVLIPRHATSIENIGVLTRTGRKVSIDVNEETSVKVNGETSSHFELKSDADGEPDRIAIGDITMQIIVRGNRVGVRLYDSKSRAMREFKGRQWFPTKPEFRIEAKYVAYDPPHTAQILNVLGDSTKVRVPGYVEFAIKGKTYRLDAQDEGEALFFNFKDATSGKSTYPAGRFLNARKPENGKVILDFNRAVNPPCAFTAYATCPLPPQNNVLKVSILAGEKTHHPVE